MSLHFSIKGLRTPPSDQCPCDTCDYALTIKGMSGKDHLRFCQKVSEKLHFDPVECDGWKQKGELPLYKLEQMAWNLLEDKRGNLIGFRSPNKTRELVDDGKAVHPNSVDPDF